MIESTFMVPTFFTDLPIIITWWAVMFVVGAFAFPLTRRLFSSWWDQGYLLSKAIGMATITYGTWMLGSLKILPFTWLTICFVGILVFILGIYLSARKNIKEPFRWKAIFWGELIFFSIFVFWSFIKAHEPDVRGLEKFMDYGFAQTILHSPYFPPPDMWYAGGTINYYYFGHLVMALLSRFSGIELSYAYNLTLATLCGLCFSMSFGIAFQLASLGYERIGKKRIAYWCVIAGFLGAFLVTFAGNMQTLYAFTKGYTGEDPPAFWTLLWSPEEFITKLPEGLNKYWYANATRFIPFTIHEFPSYSFVVSDNHGHVLSIPFVLLAIASLLSIFAMQHKNNNAKTTITHYVPYLLYGALVGILFMTNALDGPIYLGLGGLLLLVSHSSYSWFSQKWWMEKGIRGAIIIGAFLIAALPFLLNFTSFATGLAVNCPPSFLENTKIGPIIFETVDKCQKSPLWMMILLWGFFWFGGGTLLAVSYKKQSTIKIPFQFNSVTRFLAIIFSYTLGLLIFAEFFYFKDIYPAHFRSNTMFKLGYQAFIIGSLLCGYIIIDQIRLYASSNAKRNWARVLFFILIVPQLFLVSIFPTFSIRSYFGNLETYRGLYGLSWFSREYPDDFQAMLWLKGKFEADQRSSLIGQGDWLKSLSLQDTHVKNNIFTSHILSVPVIVEADGDSYTDYNRMSAFAGAPTIVGWGVHEWLWRGTYDVVAPRKDEIKEIYESTDLIKTKLILRKYNISYIVEGTLEKQKFPVINEEKLFQLGNVAVQYGNTRIFVLDKIWE